MNRHMMPKVVFAVMFFLLVPYCLLKVDAFAQSRGGTSERLTQRIESFFKTITEGNSDEAIDTIIKGGPLEKQKTSAMVVNLKEQLKTAVSMFGLPTNPIKIKEKEIAGCIYKFDYITKNEMLPLRWEFIFYKSRRGWCLIGIRIDDKIEVLF